MASALRPIRHEDRLSLVDHLDELRTRLMVCAAVLAVAFGLCLWQNHRLLHIINKPLPAFTPSERRVALPLITAIPFLFAAGVLFGYFVVLPAAVRFFVNFNSSEFNVLVQASQFYKFAATVLLAMGLVFQVPVAILAATRMGIVSPRTLRRNRRYAIVVCAVVAAFLPGDVITLVLETVPLYLLYEVSILVASFVGRADAGVNDDGSSIQGPRHPPDDPAPPPEQPAEPSVQDMIDHVDPNLSD